MTRPAVGREASTAGASRGRVLVVRHAPWEGPHRLGDVLARRFHLLERCPIDGDELPRVDAVDAAVLMGGPMNVDQHDLHPALAVEKEWIGEALARDVPTLGICLGAQLIARALGAEVRRAEEPEIGWASIVVTDPDDLVVGQLASDTVVLHWHNDIFDLPPGATPLALSARTRHQAFRADSGWALLFHPEADSKLLERWLNEPLMAAEVPEGVDWGHDPAELVRRSTRAFERFADLVESRRRASLAA